MVAWAMWLIGRGRQVEMVRPEGSWHHSSNSSSASYRRRVCGWEEANRQIASTAKKLHIVAGFRWVMP
jgi:hypothetical protein